MTVVTKVMVDKEMFKPIGYESWLDYWRQRNSYYFSVRCSAVHCSNNGEVAVPVTRIGYSKGDDIYVAPFCKRCSEHPYNTMMKLKPHTLALVAVCYLPLEELH